jgi:hypothetical protein
MGSRERGRVAHPAALSIFSAVAIMTARPVAQAQIGTPPSCEGASIDHEVFHGRFTLKAKPAGPLDATCSLGDAIEFAATNLLDERNQFLPQASPAACQEVR